MNPRVTQRDIARKAGVSHVTVSLALRDDPGIPEKTRKGIKEIADLLGYAPDPMLAALSSYRKRQRPAAYQANIAWLSSNSQAKQEGLGDFHLYFAGAETRARQLGYVLEEISLCGENKDPKRLRRLLDARNITGLILGPASVAAAELKFDFSRYSAVRTGYSYRYPNLNTVANLQFRTALSVMQKVVALGYRRIGIILTHEVDERTSWHFLGGFLAGQHFLPKKEWIAPFYVTYTSPWVEIAAAVFNWIVKQKVDCLIGTGHGKLYHTLVGKGLPFPDDVGYVDLQISEEETFFSGIHQNARQVGLNAVDLLVSMMHRHETGIPAVPTHLLIEGSWRDGKTLPKKTSSVVETI